MQALHRGAGHFYPIVKVKRDNDRDKMKKLTPYSNKFFRKVAPTLPQRAAGDFPQI